MSTTLLLPLFKPTSTPLLEATLVLLFFKTTSPKLTLQPLSILLLLQVLIFFGHPLADTHCYRCSLSNRASSSKNLHSCSSSMCIYHGIRKVKPFDPPPWPEFSFYTGELCFGFDFPSLIACGWTVLCSNMIPWVPILVCPDALRNFVDFCSQSNFQS